MDIVFIGAAAVVAAGLSFFSGFGLGTLLLPVFAIFFPVSVAVAMTSVVHLAGNMAKLIVIGKHADKNTVILFGLPAIPAAMAGAWLLMGLSGLESLFGYHLAGTELYVTPVKLVVALLIVTFTLYEEVPAFKNRAISRKYLPVGGVLSGFFGGLSGHQGALRSAFLVKCGLSKDAFIGTAAVIAAMVDMTRIPVYWGNLTLASGGGIAAVAAGVLGALTGVFLGRRFLRKVSLQTVHRIVKWMLLLIAAAMAGGAI